MSDSDWIHIAVMGDIAQYAFREKRGEAVKYTSEYDFKAFFIIMGLGQLIYKQLIKGLLYLAIFVGTLLYMITMGVNDIVGLFTLGTQY